MASPVPVLPEVGSTIVPPGSRRPSRSAASIIATAARSLIDPPGLSASIFAVTCGVRPAAMRSRRTIGVSPIASRIDARMSVVRAVRAEETMGTVWSYSAETSTDRRIIGKWP